MNPVFDKHNTQGRLYKVFLKQNKYSSNITELNYYFYTNLLKLFKFIHRRVIYTNYIRTITNPLIFSPYYTFKSQFFENRAIFNDILLKFKIKGFFLHKNFFKINYITNKIVYKKHLLGYNFFIINKNLVNNSDIYKIADNKDYSSIGKVKMFYKQIFFFDFYLNSDEYIFFIFNSTLLNILEIYKISMFLFILNFN